MAKLLKLRRGSTTQHASFTGAEGEVTIDTTKDTAVVHDGSQAGGRPLAREDMSNVSSASIAGQLGTDSIATTKIAAGALPTDVTVADANISGNLTIESADIVDGTIVNADINASAAIAGTKISPDFGSQNITTTGKVIFANVYNNESDLPSATTYHGMFAHVHSTGLAYYAHGGNWIKLAKLDAPDFTGGIDVTGDITSTGNVSGTNVILSHTTPTIQLNDSNDNPDYVLQNNNGVFRVRDNTNSADRIVVNTDGHVDVAGNLDAGAGVDVTGNITVTGTVDGRDVAQDGGKLDELYGGSNTLKNTVNIANGVTATTQSAGDNSTKVATTAYTDTAITNLVDSSPGALNTLNELAAAINDDANFSTTITNNIATKMPLSGGTFTGAVTGTTIADSKGDLRKLPLNAQSSNYTLVASDAGKFIRRTGGNVTVPNGVFSTGDMVTILNDTGSSMTVTQGSSFSLINTGDASTGNRTITQRGMATILFNASNQGYISGSGLE